MNDEGSSKVFRWLDDRFDLRALIAIGKKKTVPVHKHTWFYYLGGITLMLFGVVLRGSSFVFRAYDDRDDAHHQRWSRIFAISSVFTPVMLGICVGTVASGRIRMVDGQVVPEFWTWLSVFPVVVGLFTLIGVAGYRLVRGTQDAFLRYLILGFVLIVCLQAGINMLVNVGWSPAKGIDLPFVSSGGTSLLFCLSAAGIIGNAARCDRRQNC